MNDKEKDVYIKAKLKNVHIPEKIDDLFKNSINIIENKGVEYIEENSNINSNNQNNPKKKKMPIALKRVLATAACVTVVLGGGNLYASTQGYDNIFFLIKNIVMGEEVRGKESILTDRDITISYRPIEITKGTQIQINNLVIKNNEAKLKVQVKETDLEELTTPLKYIIKDENGTELHTYKTNKSKVLLSGDANCDGKVNSEDLGILKQYLAGNEQKITEDGKENIDTNGNGEVDTVDLSDLITRIDNFENDKYRELHYKEEIILNGFKEETKKIILEIYDTNSKKISDLEIDLESKSINVVGTKEELTKISEEELKEYLGAFATLSYKGKNIKATTLDEQKILVALRIAENNNIDLYTGEKEYNDTGFNLVLNREKVHKMIKSFTELELNEDGNINDNEMIYVSRIKGKNQYVDTSWTEDFEPTCLDVTDIVYSGGIYNVTFKFCYSTKSQRNFTSITTIEDLPVYEMTMGLILDEKSGYSKYRISTMSDTILIEENLEDTEKDNTEKKEIIDDTDPNMSSESDQKEAKNIIQGFMNIIIAHECSSVEMLEIEEIGLLKDNKEWNKIKELNEKDLEGYVKTDIKYDEFKNKMLEYMTEGLFKIYSYEYKNVDGNLWVLDAGTSGVEKIEILNVQLKDAGEDIKRYRATWEITEFDNTEKVINRMFELQKNEQGKYVVSAWGDQIEKTENVDIDEVKEFIELIEND